MNETKIEIVKGKVQQAGYDEAFCTIIKADVNRNDSLSDKPLYIVEDIEIADGVYAVTPNVTEALNRSPRKTIGVMNENGELLIPIINSDIVKINDKYIAVKTTSSMEELEMAKSDPTKVQENALVSQQIKNKVLEINPNARFVCDDYYGTYDVYEINDKTLVRTYDNANYIATSGEDVYIQSNRIEDEVKVIEKQKQEPNVTMPVGALADVNDMPLDNLGELPEMPEELPGAPALTEGDNFKIDDVATDLSSFENNIEMPVQEEVKEPEETIEQEEAEPIKEIYEEKTEEEIQPVYEEEKETIFKEEYKPEMKYESRENVENTNINEIVNAVKAKIEENKEIIEKLRKGNNKKDEELKSRTEELKEKDEEISEKDAEISRLKIKFNKVNAELKEKDDEIAERDAEISRLRMEMSKKDDKISSLKEKYREDMKTVVEEFSGILDDNTKEDYSSYSRVA